MEMTQDIYEDLREATVQDLLMAWREEIASYPETSANVLLIIDFTIKVAGKDGWENIAPAWLRRVREKQTQEDNK